MSSSSRFANDEAVWTVDEYDPRWVQQFEAICAAIVPALEGLDARVEHVGSTSVPGLAAKPIIDVDVVVARAADVSEAIARLEGIGYRHLGDLGIPGRDAFDEPDDGFMRRHLYVVVAGSVPYRDHVELRDRLRSNPADAARYAQRKREVEELLAVDLDAYVEAKAPVVQSILSAARREPRHVLEAMIAMFDSGDTAAVGDVVSESYVDHQGLGRVEVRGVSGFRSVVAAARGAFSELRAEPVELIAERDCAVARIRWHGIHADGKVVERETIDMVRVANGLAVEHWGAQLSTTDPFA